MQIGPLVLPDEVLTALEERRLVIFAGAGVSIPSPASLPSFQSLVEGIVGRSLSKEEEGQMDRILGRAKEQGVPVHQLAAKHLSPADSRFNSLHENLVALFGSAAVRIVTTNFDLHFEGALAARSRLSDVKVYTASALPVGSSFTGLVHLHGALGSNPAELVLTDADFGRAYLTEGWAGRFVVELFREYVVLFVGYSYGDTVMSYLTRGLSPTFGRQRFALTEIDQREKWQFLGIEPIDYDPADHHRALAEGLSQWVSYERRGFLDWGQRLPALVGREPQALAPDEQGELEFCLRNPKRAKLFYQHAKDPRWLQWAEWSGRLHPLFSFEGDQESLQDLASWFTQDPLGSRGKVALEISLKPIRPVGRALAILASQQVRSALAELNVLEENHVRRAAAWATLLIERTAPNTPSTHLSFWLDHISPRDHPQLAAQILAHLLRCQPVFREGISLGEERGLDLSLDTPSLGVDYLRHYWSKLREHIGALAWPLVPVITEIFEARWRWQATLVTSTPRNDPWTWDRSWVERPTGEIDGSLHGRRVGPLLDVGKDVLDELLTCDAEKGTAVIELWLAAGAPQLVQLGLYGLAKSQLKPAEKLERLIAKHLPAKIPFRVETFRVLRESYPKLSLRQRERFLRRAKHLYWLSVEKFQQEPDRRRSAVYEWFSALAWLEQVDPADSLLKRRIREVRKLYPDFQPREHPELDIPRGPRIQRVQETSRLTSEEISHLSLHQWLEELEASRARQQREEFAISHVRGFLEETARAASEHLEWGLSFTRSLLESRLFDHQIWSGILTAWGSRAFRPSEWKKVLEVLDHPYLLAAQTAEITEVLQGQANQKEPRATGPMLRDGLRLAEKLLSLGEEVPFAILSENEAWLNQAINHPGGWLARFLISAIGELLGPNPRQNSGIPRTCKRLLDAMVRGTGRASAMGRILLAVDIHFFLGIAPDWTRADLLPLFDWDRDTLQAVQAWHGFLALGRVGAELLEELTPSAVQLSSHLAELRGERPNYGRFVARAAFSLPDDPLGKAWFQAFLSKADDDDRAHFAWTLNELLETLQPEQKAEIWRDWLSLYLERRAQFPPLPEGQEITALAAWPFHLPGQLVEFVECLEALPGRGASADQLLWKLQEGELAGSDANLLARLALALLKRCEEVKSWDLPTLRAVIERLIDECAHENLVRELVEKYLEHGGLNHTELLERLQKRSPDKEVDP